MGRPVTVYSLQGGDDRVLTHFQLHKIFDFFSFLGLLKSVIKGCHNPYDRQAAGVGVQNH